MGGLPCCVSRESDTGGDSGALVFLGREFSAPQRAAAVVGDADTCTALLGPSSGASSSGQADEVEKKLEEGGQPEGRPRGLSSASDSEGRGASSSPPPPAERKISGSSSPGGEAAGEGRPRGLSSASDSEGRGASSSPPPPAERKISGSSSPGGEAAGEAEGCCLLVRGFPGPQSLDGRYAMVLGACHHGRAIFRRPREKEYIPGKGRRLRSPAVLFFWDERDGLQHCGWCFGPHVGSKTVWAFNPGDVDAPPMVGWRQPWFSEVLPGARVFPAAGPSAAAAGAEEEQRAAELLEAEVRPADVGGNLADAIAAFRTPQPLNICADCRRPIRSPCALPCGHLVCLEHVSQANAPHVRPPAAEQRASPRGEGSQPEASEAPEQGEGRPPQPMGQYKCPCTPECHTYLQNGGVSPDGWGIASVSQQLLALAGPEANAAPSLRSLKTSSFWEETAGQAVGGLEGARRGVLACDTPLRLVAAYEWLGHEAGLAARAGEAAAAFEAAKQVHVAFLGEVAADGLEPPGGDGAMPSPESLTLAACARRELMDCAVRWQREAGAKAAAWAKRCGCRARLAAAAETLPAPAAEGLAADGRGIVEALRPRRAAARQLLDCPVCYRLLLEPTTTPCGHTFCRGCLARVLDAATGCPLCRGPLCGFVGFYAACRPLQCLVEELWPEESAARDAERSAELRDARVGDDEHLALLVPGTLALPHQRLVFHVSEPQHRLMIRRALESGQRRVGMCLADSAQGFSEYGVELCIRWARMAADGRAAVECVGARPFRVVESFMHDGCSIAKVEFFEAQNESDGPEAFSAREELLAGARELAGGAAGEAQADAFPPLDNAEAWDAVAWVFLASLPASPAAKYRCLATRFRAQRLAAIAALVRELLATVASAQETAEESVQDLVQFSSEHTSS